MIPAPNPLAVFLAGVLVAAVVCAAAVGVVALASDSAPQRDKLLAKCAVEFDAAHKQCIDHGGTFVAEIKGYENCGGVVCLPPDVELECKTVQKVERH